jgi:outer membrane protein OmpA-like peptidoglycan-associated protein
MTSGLYETLRSAIGPGFTRTASAALDEHEYGIGRTMDAAFAAILTGLERNAGDAGVMSEIARLVGERGNDTAILSGSAGLLAPGASSGLGERLLATLFGARTETIGAAIARASGVGSQSAATMLPHAGSLVLALLGKRLGAGVPPANAVAGLVAGERGVLSRSVPGYLRSLISSVRDAGTKIPDAAALSGAGSLAWLLLPVLLLVGLAWYLMSLDSGTGERRTAASDPTSTTWRPADREREQAGWSDSRTGDARTGGETRPAARDTRTAVREETPSARKSTGDWSWDREPARPAAPSSSSSTWTAPTTSTAPATRSPPLPGLVRVRLVGGTEIDIMPEGVEQKVKDLVEDRWASIDKARWFDFDRIRFRTGSSDLTPGSRVQLRNTAAILAAYPNVRIKIGGYTDNVGDPQSNLRLSDERAKRVMAELVKLGVAADRVEAEGYGDQHPIADNSTPEGRAKNRRTAVSVRAK